MNLFQRTKFSGAIALLVTCLIFVAACTSGGNTAPATGGDGEPTGSEPIKIGVVLPFSPPGDVTGAKTAVDAIKIAVEEINTRGLLGRQVELVYGDTQGVPDKAVAAVERLLANEKIVALIGNWTSSECLASIEVVHRAGIPNLHGACSADQITAKHYPEVFRVAPYDSQFAEFIVNYLSDTGIKKAGISAESSAYGLGLAETIDAIIAKKGLDIETKLEIHDAGATDLTPQLLALKRWGAEAAVHIAVSAPNMYLFTSQSWEVGLAPNAKLLAAWDWPTLPDYWSINGDKGVGLHYLTMDHPDARSEQTKEFVKTFSEKWGYEPSFWAFVHYDAMHILAAAIERAGTTEPAAVITELEKTKHEGLYGLMEFELGEGARYHQWTTMNALVVEITEPNQAHEETTVVWPK